MKRDLTSMAKEAWVILNDIGGDLIIATKSFDALEPRLKGAGTSPYLLTGFRRMFYFHLFIALSKWFEFYDRYKAVITADCKRECAGLRKELVGRSVVRFRNSTSATFVITKRGAHFRLKRAPARPTPRSGGQRHFLLWVLDPEENVFPKTVVSVVETTRNRIAETHSLEPQVLLKDAGAIDG